MDAVIEGFLEEGPDPEQLERIKTQLRAAEIYARDNLQRRARQVGVALTSGLTLEDVRDWPAALEAVTAEDVVAAARAVFRPETSVTGWLLGTGEAVGGGTDIVIGTEVTERMTRPALLPAALADRDASRGLSQAGLAAGAPGARPRSRRPIRSRPRARAPPASTSSR
jgi:hypothetical protein